MHRTAYILLIATALFWGGNAVAGKFAAGHVSPMLLTAMRWVIALSILLVIGHRHFRAERQIVAENLRYLMIMGMVGLTGFNVCLYAAVNFTTAINVSILQAAIPMVVFVGNFLLFAIRVSYAQIAGFLITVAGVVLIAAQGSFQRLLALEINFGDGLMLFGIVAYGGYTIAIRKMPKLHWQSMMIALATGALISACLFALIEWLAGFSQWPDRQGWLVIAYTAIFPSIRSQIFFIMGNRMIGGNRAGLFINLVPIFGTGLSVLLLAERFHPFHAIALALVFGGIWLAERKA
ncbi:MAG: DMT family transporter [Rhodobacteraceae bacterium]|nr:DMT family transporter [Paracoccaceae bacterium]